MTPADNRGPSASAVTLLIVDDHSTNRLVLTRLAAALGYAADTAANGEEGLRAWLRARHAFILADCNMPVMDGYEMTRQIRQREAARSSRRATIVGFTSRGEQDTERLCLEAGMDDCLYKPATPDALQGLLARWLSR